MLKRRNIRVRLLMGAIVVLAGLILSACEGPFSGGDNEPNAEAEPVRSESNGVAESESFGEPNDSSPVRAEQTSTTGQRTINLTVDDSGLSLDTMFVPQGTPTKLIFRNLTRDEYHYHVSDMPTSELLFGTEDGDMDELEAFVAMFEDDDGDHDHHEHHEDHDDHADHHRMLEFGKTPGCKSRYDECPTGESVHAHALPMELDVLIFTPEEPGTYMVTCPLHDDFQARIIVY